MVAALHADIEPLSEFLCLREGHNRWSFIRTESLFPREGHTWWSFIWTENLCLRDGHIVKYGQRASVREVGTSGLPLAC